MALQDLARRSGFTHDYGNSIFLQLEMPASNPRMRDSFGCQLLIDQGEWNGSDIGTLIESLQPGQERGRIGSIAIRRDDKVEFGSDASRKYRLLSFFGKEAEFGARKFAGLVPADFEYHFDLNVRIRCLDVERKNIAQGGEIWLVRGEILSGGLLFRDPGPPDMFAQVDLDRIWPSRELRGIFFSGSELQIETGTRYRKIVSGDMPSTQPVDMPDRVNINRVSTGTDVRSALVRFRNQNQVNWSPLYVIVEYAVIPNAMAQIRLDRPIPSGQKPGSNWDYQIFEGDPIKKYRLTDISRNSASDSVVRARWEQISAKSALSLSSIEPEGLPVEPHSKAIDDFFEKIKVLCDQLNPQTTISIARGSRLDSRLVVLVDDMDKYGADGKPKSSLRKFLKIDWEFKFEPYRADPSPVRLAQSFTWRPRTLEILDESSASASYVLHEADLTDAALHGSPVHDTGPTVRIEWKSVDATRIDIPETLLIGTAFDAARQRPAASKADRELWFQASCDPVTAYGGLPSAWANITAQEPPAVPTGTGPSTSGLSGPVFLKINNEWTLEAAPVDPGANRATAVPGVRLTLARESSTITAKLELFAADVTLDSPKFRIYDKPVKDPKSVPNERRPQDGTLETSLRFIHRPEWERVPPNIDHALVCTFETDKFVLRRDPQAVRLFLPAERALVDPVSVTRGNLVGRQIVAFPVLLRPTDRSKLLKVVSAQPGIDPSGKSIATLVLELESEEFPADNPNLFEDFFAQLEPNDSKIETIVARIRKLKRDNDDKTNKTATLEIVTDKAIESGTNYRLSVGPTRLALPRDVNHGLIPIGVSEFEIAAIANDIPSLRFALDTIRGEEGQSVLTLHPWSEWGPRPNPNGKPWLETGRVRLHHRNLIQEHAEFESSFEDRFPPEGPARNPDGTTPGPSLPLADFVRAVRDRYTEATGNLIAPSADLAAKAVRNWLPNSILKDAAGGVSNPRVEISLDASDLTILPKAEVRTAQGDIAKDPFSFEANVNGTVRHLRQSLKLRKTHKPKDPDPDFENDKVGADQHWLDVSLTPDKLEIGNFPEIRLAKTDPTDVTSRRAVDSSVPLLFSRHDICALASIDLADGRAIAIAGSPERQATVYVFDNMGAIQRRQSFPGGALVDVALLRPDSVIRGLAIRKNGNDSELVRFTIDPSSGMPNVDSRAITMTGMPVMLASTPGEASASVFVLTTKPGVFAVDVETGPGREIAGAGAGATAIGADFVGGQPYLAVGTGTGTVSVWRNTGGTWARIADGDHRLDTSPLLGADSSAGLEIPKARSIRSLRVRGDMAQPGVVAVDGSRFPCHWVWKIDDPATPLPVKAAAQVWLQPSDALCVSFGRVKNLEQRQTNDAVPLFALGLRSGVVRISAAIARPEVLTAIRQFDAAESPVNRLSLAGSEDPATPAVCFAGTSAGGLLAWDARTGAEWPEAPTQPSEDFPHPIAPKTFFDALGVVRALPSATAGSDLTVDELSIGTDTFRSVSTCGLKLVVDELHADAAEASDITDIRLWSDAFKIRDSGSVDPRKFPDGDFDPGHIAFFSAIKAANGLKSLAVFDHVPRLAGIPFFVTGIRMLKLNAAQTAIEIAELEGVPINPDEIAAGQDPADAGTLPGVVARAMSRGSIITVKIESGTWSVLPAESLIDWTFAVNRQVPIEGAEGFPAALARIRSKSVTAKKLDNRDRLCFEIDETDSKSLVFGRLWPLGDSVQLVSHASFRRESASDPWEQTGYSFRTSAETETLTCEHRWETSTGNPTVSTDPQTLVWDGGRYVSFHLPDDRKVHITDRMTGLAFDTPLFEHGQTSPEIITTAILETTDVAGEMTLTVAAGRATPVSSDKGLVEFGHWDGEALADGPIVSKATKASWGSEKLKGYPVVRLCGPSFGEIDHVSVVNGLARLHAREESPLPAEGAGLSSTVLPDNVRVFGLDRISRTFSLAQDLKADEATSVGFIQFVRRIETSAQESGSHRLTISDSGSALAVDDHVRVITNGNAQIGKIVDVVGPLVSGLASPPVAGSLLQRLFAVTEVVDPDEKRATVRLKSNTEELVDRSIFVHSEIANDCRLYLALNRDEFGFDLYQPATITPPVAETYKWRAVHSILSISHDPGEAKIDIGPLPLPAFTKIGLTEIADDGSLIGVWDTIPESGTFVLLCRVKIGDGAAIDNPGTWTANGAAPITVASIDNQAGVPVVVTTTEDHGLIDGDIVEIAGVVGAAAINGQARVQIMSPKTFRLYAVAAAVPGGSGGFWERLDQDETVSAITADRLPVVLSAGRIPEVFSRFRLILDDTAQDEVFFAGPAGNSRTSWEALSPVLTFDKDATYWSPSVSMEPGDGKTVFLRTRSAILPKTVSTAISAFDRMGTGVLQADPVRMIRIDRRGVYLTREVTRLNDGPASWSIRSTAAAFVRNDADSGNRLVFDAVPPTDTNVPPNGTTKAQANPIEFLETGRCGGRSVAITADGGILNVWPIDVPVADLEPAQKLSGAGNVSALAAREIRESLWVAAVRGGQLSIYRLDDAHGKAVSVSVALGSTPTTVLAAITEHEDDVVVAISDGKALKFWRIRAKSDGMLDTPEPIWGKTQVNATDTIIRLAGGLDAGTATFLVGLRDHVGSIRAESWSPTGFVVIRSGESNAPSPRAALGVDIGVVPAGANRKLTARLHPSRRVRFDVKKDLITFRAFAQLEQGGYRCLTLHPTTPDASRGRGALALWTTGDLARDVFDPAVGRLELHAASVELEQSKTEWTNPHPLTFTAGTKTVDAQDAAAFASSLTTYVGDLSMTKLGTTIVDFKLGYQRVRILLESDLRSENRAVTTGVLILTDSTSKVEKPLLQAVVRCKFDPEKNALELIDDVFWSTKITPQVDGSEADILLPEDPGKKAGSTSFSVTGFSPGTDSPRGFVRLRLTSRSPWLLGTVEVDGSLVPLIPELEPSLVQAPDRIGNDSVRLAHRLRAGLAARPVVPRDFLSVSIAQPPTAATEVPTTSPDGSALLLDTVVTVENGPVLRLRPEGWLVPMQVPDDKPLTDGADSESKKKVDERKPVKKYRTEGLFVLNVDFRRNDIPAVSAVESRTREFGPNEPVIENERERYRQLLRAAGVQGVAVNYRLTDGQVADLGFIDSPFYDHAGESFRDTAGSVSTPAVAAASALAVQALASAAAIAAPWVFGFDPRLRLPGKLGNERASGANRYLVADLPADPYADVCCLAHRQYRLERRSPIGGEHFEPAETPILHNAEVPAFRQPALVSSPLAGRWSRTNPVDGKPSIPQVFFPPRIDWELAADKPGAMFQSVVQARVTNRNGETRREPLIDFALREPQFVRLARCVTAEVYWQTGPGETTVSQPEDGYTNVDLVWTEVLGSVQVQDVRSGEWLKPAATGIALSRTPLQLVIDFNSEVFLVNQADAAVPAYRVEAQPDGGVAAVTVLPAATFLVANPDVATVFAPQKVAPQLKLDCLVTHVDGVWKAKLSGGTIPSGTTLTLTDFQTIPGLNDVAHRLVGNSGETFELMQDTAPDLGVPNSFSIKVGADDYTATIRCRRPLCVDLSDTPNDSNGRTITSTNPAAIFRRLRDGEKVTDMRLAQVVPGGKQYLIVTPSQLPVEADGKSGKAVDVTTQAAGYLEASVREKVDVKSIPDISHGAWTPALQLEQGEFDKLSFAEGQRTVRIDDPKTPQANGVFEVIGTEHWLARPSVGNGRVSTTGKAVAFLNSTDAFTIEKVDGTKCPIEITLDAGTDDPDWETGTTAVSVTEVTDVPQANGSWVVRRIETRRYALYEPSTAEIPVSEIKGVTASAVFTLREAFEDLPGSPRLARLKLEPNWKALDRPLLQIHWAGAGHFKNDDGKGVAWRPGGMMVGLYEQIKQVKFLANSQLSPKLAFVMTASAGPSWQRTILFGDSAPPFEVEPELAEAVDEKGTKTTRLSLKIPNNRESLSVPVPRNAGDSFVLHVVKSMPSGVAIYDNCTVKSGGNAHLKSTHPGSE